jgi:hypothetical protein
MMQQLSYYYNWHSYFSIFDLLFILVGSRALRAGLLGCRAFHLLDVVAFFIRRRGAFFGHHLKLGGLATIFPSLGLNIRRERRGHVLHVVIFVATVSLIL